MKYMLVTADARDPEGPVIGLYETLQEAHEALAEELEAYTNAPQNIDWDIYLVDLLESSDEDD